MKKRKYLRLDDRLWLTEQYINQHKSTTEIAKKIGCDASCVGDALKKYSIPVRNKRQAQLARNRNNDSCSLNVSVLTGCLLGDGSLHSNNRNSKLCAPYFIKNNIYLDHVQFVADTIGLNHDRIKYRDKIHPCYSISSLSSEYLKTIYSEWYPEHNGFRKTVPQNIQLDKAVLLHWFLDDGLSFWDNNKQDTRATIVFCSESFTKNDQLFLCKKIYDEFKISTNLKTEKWGTGWRIRVDRDSNDIFWDTIGPAPVDSLSHKWKINSDIRFKNTNEEFADWLYNKYYIEPLSISQIALEANLTESSIYHYIYLFKKTLWADKNLLISNRKYLKTK